MHLFWTVCKRVFNFLFMFGYHTLYAYTRFSFISNLGFCLELGLLNSETEIGTGVI